MKNIIKQLTALLVILSGLTLSLHAEGGGDDDDVPDIIVNSSTTFSGTVADALYMTVGQGGTGDLTLVDHAVIGVKYARIGGIENYDHTLTGTGSVLVSGHAFLSGSEYIILGDYGDSFGKLILTDSGSASTSALAIGLDDASRGEVIISGSAFLYASELVLVGGNDSMGKLALTDSGSLVTEGDYMQNSRSTLDITLTGGNHARVIADTAGLDGAITLNFVNTGTLRASEVTGTHTILHTAGGITGHFTATSLNASTEDYITLTTEQTASDYNAVSDLSWNKGLHGAFIVSGSTTFIVDTALNDSGTVRSLVKDGGGTLIFESVSNYTGSTVINSGTVIYNQAGDQTLHTISGSGVLVQQGGGVLTVEVSSDYDGTVINRSNLSLGGVDQQIHTLINNGSVHFINLGKTLTLTNLSGSGGFHMEVNITTGESDKIVVTGTLSGTHRLNITNLGGDHGNDFNITLATAANHDNGAFVSDFDIGMFACELQGTGTRYYITRGGTAPRPGPTGEDLLAALPSQSQSWFDNNNIISGHLGGLRGSINANVSVSDARERRPLGGGILDAAWIKSYGAQVNVSDRVVGTSFREYQYGVDAGTDHRWTLDKNNTLILGGFVGYGSLDRTLRNGLQNEGSTDNYHFGAYGIWLHDSGLYADFIAKAQYADHEVSAWDASHNHTTADYDNWGGGITFDLGKQFKFKDGWYAEPSLSAGYAHFTGETYTARNLSPFTVSISDADVFQFKFGLQLGRTIIFSNGGILQPYVKISGVEQVSTGGKLRASGAEWRPTLDGISAEIGGGIIWQLNADHQLSLDYEASFGDKYDKPWGLTAGYRYQF